MLDIAQGAAWPRRYMAVIPVWASEAIDLITTIVPAADLVGLLAAEPQEALSRAGKRPVEDPAR